MKSKTKVFVISTAFVVLGFIYYVGFLAPYNLQGMLNPKGLGVINQNSFKEIDELAQYFKGYKINKVKYLGSDAYEVITDKGEFVILADYSDTMYWKYKIFKYNKNIQHFTNPM